MTSELQKDLAALNAKYAGTYLLNRYFIKIDTGQKLVDQPGYDPDKRTISDEDQLRLQLENFPTIYHEYIHYVHEISTICGTTQFYMEAIRRAIFSGFVNVPKDSTASPVTGPDAAMYHQINETTSSLFGGTLSDLDGQIIYRIVDIKDERFDAYIPFNSPDRAAMKIPVIQYKYAHPSTNTRDAATVYFGRYYIYEGIAHHLDQLVSKRMGRALTPEHKVKPEYKLMKQVALHLFANLDERSMLELASLSLSYWNCGEMFVNLVKEAAMVAHLAGFIVEQQNKVSETLIASRQDFIDTMESVVDIYRGRPALQNSAKHLVEEMIKGYDRRTQQPTFEIDVTYSGHFDMLANYVKHCNLVYEFTDTDDYLRDFAGTNFQNVSGTDLMTFLCHVDYYENESKGVRSHCCPLYSFCPKIMRQQLPQQCRLQPRLSFEKGESLGWCEYGLGVGYMKGTINELP